jgi:hypothetical protein
MQLETADDADAKGNTHAPGWATPSLGGEQKPMVQIVFFSPSPWLFIDLYRGSNCMVTASGGSGARAANAELQIEF